MAATPRLDVQSRVGGMITNSVSAEPTRTAATRTDVSDGPLKCYVSFDPEKEIVNLVPFAAAGGLPCCTWLPLVRDVWEYPSPF